MTSRGFGNHEPVPATKNFLPPRAGLATVRVRRDATIGPRPLYTAAERLRRNASPWTLVQGVLAPLQFAIFLVSAALAVRFLMTGQGFAPAVVSSVAKVAALYLIMVTGACWERAVFGRFLFAPAFFAEDAVSMVVIALHTAYLLALLGGWLAPRPLMVLTLAAYATYVVNAGQFVLKLRRARRDGTGVAAPAGAAA